MSKWEVMTLGISADSMKQKALVIAEYLGSLPDEIARSAKVFGVITEQKDGDSDRVVMYTTAVVIHEHP